MVTKFPSYSVNSEDPRQLPDIILNASLVGDEYEERQLDDTGYDESVQQTKSHTAEPLKKLEDIDPYRIYGNSSVISLFHLAS